MSSNSNSNNTEEKLENETEDIKAMIAEIRKDTCIFLLSVLQSILSEQISARTLDRATGSYIINAFEDQCKQMGWIGKK
jgi:hypothetical protein